MTPTCLTCNTKFPGKVVCKACGADPNAEPTLAHKIEREMAKKVKVITEVKLVSVGPVSHSPFGSSGWEPNFTIIDELHVWKDRTTVKARAARRARLRSLRATATSGRHVKHGRVGVRR